MQQKSSSLCKDLHTTQLPALPSSLFIYIFHQNLKLEPVYTTLFNLFGYKKKIQAEIKDGIFGPPHQ